MPAVSVILPTCNRHDLLPRALHSLTQQTFNDFEILLVDDNPVDNRLANNNKLTSLLEDKRVRLIEHHCSIGCANAKNAGLSHARGDWITYLDDDNMYHPEKIQLQLERAESTRSPLVLCGIFYDLGLRKRVKQVGASEFCGEDIFLRTIPDTNTLFHRNDGQLRYNEDFKIGDDAYLFFSIVHRYSLEIVPNVAEALVRYYILNIERVNTQSATEFWKTHRKLYLEFIRKYPRRSARIYLARVLLNKDKFQSCRWMQFFKNSIRLIKIGGIREWRLILNVLFAKIPWVKRFVIT